jgi:hypothetical protein
MKNMQRIAVASRAFKVNGTKQILMNLVLAVAFMASHQALMAAGPAPVNLGSAAQFVILSETGITTAGQAYTITGNVGTSPAAGSYEIDLVQAQVVGTIYEVVAGGPAGAVTNASLLTTAIGDLGTAIADAAGRTPIPTGPNLNPNSGNIGGMTLAPGLYKFTTTAYITGKNVTLMGTGGSNDVWIFQCAQDLQVGDGIQVILAGGAQAGNIFWQVETGAVIGTTAAFQGTIMAGTAITMNTGSTMSGRALAETAVAFDGSSITLPAPVAGAVQGSLQVTIEPTNAVGAGAQWQVNGGTLQNSGATVTNVSVSNYYTVSFTPISGWITPSNQTVMITNGAATTASGTYTTNGQAGALTVTLLPAAVTNVAQWQVDGGTTNDSGATVTNLAPGSHTVSFTPISGWKTPDGQTVTITNEATTTATATYTSGSLQVTIEPSDAVGAGAQWRVDGGPVQNSGATVTNLLVGPHTVSFTPISGLKTPADQTVTIANGLTTTIGVYTLTATALSGALTVTLLPAAVTNVAQWWVDNGSNQNSGVTVTNLTAGSHTVSFTPVTGWNTPSNQEVAITDGVTTLASGIYTSTSTPANELTLLTNGDGTIQHAAYAGWPTNLGNDKTYKVTAVPKAKNVFSGWVASGSQSFVSNKASLTFTMTSGLVLEANFVTNVFLAAEGNYRGLFAPTNSARQQTNSGSFLFSVTSSGAVSGHLDLGGKTVPFSGKFDLGGTATNIVSRSEPSLTTTLQLDFADQSVSGTVSNDTFIAALNGDRDVFSGSQKATHFEGQYTLVIPGTTNTNAGPFGVSYGTVKVSDLGTITLAGSLADGTAISQSSVVSQDGYWPLYVSLYGGKGSLWGWNYFTNHTITNAAVLSWINETNSSRTAVYRSGFTNQDVTLTGGLYVSTNTLPTNLTATLEGGDLPFAITNGVTISARDKITLTNSSDETNKLKLTITKSTGVISGSFANPVNPKKTIKVNGVILQGQTNAQGYFLGTNQSGSFTLDPP